MFIALACALAAGLSLLLNIAVLAPTYRDDMPGGPYPSDGLFDPPGLEFGFFNPEKSPEGITYQWTTSRASVTFPYMGNAGRYARVSLALAANVAPGQKPATVTVVLNGRPQPGFVVSGLFRTFTFTLDTRETPNPYLDPSHVQVDIESTTASTPTDRRELGVAVDSISVTPVRSQAELAAESAVWAVSLLLILWVALARLGPGWAIRFGLAALLTFAVIHLFYMPGPLSVSVEIALVALAWLLAVWLAPIDNPTWGVALALFGLWMLLASHILGDWRMDDSYISYRYAWNFVHGYGLVYNPGQVVEGYTNFLWTLVAAGAITVGLPPASVALVLSIAFSQCVLALTFVLGRRLSGSSAWAMLAVGLLSVDASLITYGARGSGIEAVPFALLVLAAIALLWAKREGAIAWRAPAGAVLALASLTRPEGILVAGLLLLVKAWQDRRLAGLSFGRVFRLLLAAGLPYLLIMLPYEAWRITFYGYPFPNTFYAKTGATAAIIGRGLEYAWIFAGDHWLPVSLLIAGLWLALWRRREGSRAGAEARHTGGGLPVALAALAAVYALYIVVAGGDHFPAGRFFVPMLPPIALLSMQAARGLVAFFSRPRGGQWAAMAGLALLVLLYMVYALWLQRPQGEIADRTKTETVSVDIWGSAGLWLRDNTPQGATTAVEGAGAIAYYSRRQALDMYGLNDLRIGHMNVPTLGEYVAGHEKRDPQYVLDSKPGYILRYWDPYFVNIRSQLERQYRIITVVTPTGYAVDWWKLK